MYPTQDTSRMGTERDEEADTRIVVKEEVTDTIIIVEEEEANTRIIE